VAGPAGPGKRDPTDSMMTSCAPATLGGAAMRGAMTATPPAVDPSSWLVAQSWSCRDFPIVWVVTEDEWESSDSDPDIEAASPWPVASVRVLESAWVEVEDPVPPHPRGTGRTGNRRIPCRGFIAGAMETGKHPEAKEDSAKQ
jgi:hypothetical protein